MANILFATTDLIKSATLSSGLSTAQMDIGNLKRRNPSDGLRLLDLSQAWIQIDLGQATAINLISPLYVSATTSAQWRVRAATSAAGLLSSPGYDSGSIALSGSAGLLHRDKKIHGQLYFSTPKSFRYWRIDFYDPSNPNGFLDLGALVIDQAFQPDHNVSYGWTVGLRDISSKQKSLAGSVSPVLRKKYMTMQLSLECQDKASMFADLFSLDQKIGITEPILIIKDPEEPEIYRQQQTLYGLITELSPIVNDHFGLYSKRYEVEELIA